MCGIFAIINARQQWQNYGAIACQFLKHRGPDNADIVKYGNNIFAHTRLSIVDKQTGKQPFNIDGIILTVNGEIYNHKELWRKHIEVPPKTHSDCEILLRLYQKYGDKMLEEAEIRGMFAFVIYDTNTGNWCAGRDHMGIIPMYIVNSENGIIFTSEIKTLTLLGLSESELGQVRQFTPGCILSQNGHKFHPLQYNKFHDNLDVRTYLEDAVKSHMMCDTKYGVLLSGGVDSSIIASIVAKMSTKKIHSFCIGLEGSPDLEYAQKVANYIGTEHHSFTFTVQEGIAAIPEVIYYVETFDVTTIRASTPMYLLAKKIREFDPEIRMLFSGEGADEIFGGYLYFHNAPNEAEMQRELIDKVHDLHLFDCLRANKSMMAHSIELRPPFLDKKFMEYAMNIHPRYKMIRDGRIEKQILRDAFAGDIPDEVLWRQKEQFSDGVGYEWINTLKKLKTELDQKEQIWEVQTPKTDEAYYYREIYESYFGRMHTACKYLQTFACGTAKSLEWDPNRKGEVADPSGRSVSVHIQTRFTKS